MKPSFKATLVWVVLGMLVGLVAAFLVLSVLSSSTDKPKTLPQATALTLPPTQAPVSYADIVTNVLPAVVSIYSIRVDNQANQQLLEHPHYSKLIKSALMTAADTPTSLGSGVIISHEGHILTNFHVIKDADRLVIDLHDGRSTEASILGIDRETDLALLKITLTNLQPAPVPHQDQVRLGDIVLAIGNPHGLGTSVSMGIISGLGRNQLGLNTFENFIQTDAPINQGNSGGALINTQGQLIGINTAIISKNTATISSQGLGLAIPISTATQVAHDLFLYGGVVRGWLGIEMSLVSQQGTQRNATESVKITGIYVNSPAHKAGLQPGDIILRFNELEASPAREAMNYVANLKPGSVLDITYLRQGKTLTTQAILDTRPIE